VFTLEPFDVVGIVDTFVGAAIVFVGEFSSARWTRIGTLFSREVYGEMDVEEGLADGDVGTQVALVGSDTRGHILGAEAACGWISEFVGVVEVASERKTVGEPFNAQGALVDVWAMCLLVEGAFEGIVGPIDAMGTGIAAAESQGLGLMHTLDGGDR
jgi:hypothetical protein